MRNIIFTSIAAITISGMALAEPTFGCFTRDYSDDHLAKHPEQIVDQIRLKLKRQPEYGEWIGLLDVKTANQGHVRTGGHGGEYFSQFLICWENGGTRGCSVECDGGSFDITKDDGKILQFRTQYLMVGETEECGGAVDLAEKRNQPVSYRLTRADDAACADM